MQMDTSTETAFPVLQHVTIPPPLNHMVTISSLLLEKSSIKHISTLTNSDLVIRAMFNRSIVTGNLPDFSMKNDALLHEVLYVVTFLHSVGIPKLLEVRRRSILGVWLPIALFLCCILTAKFHFSPTGYPRTFSAIALGQRMGRVPMLLLMLY